MACYSEIKSLTLLLHPAGNVNHFFTQLISAGYTTAH